jgi:CheY-like chemotaxis protein
MNAPAPRASCDGVVVIVEDEVDARELLQEVIESHGYRVATAQDGVEALDIFRAENVCFVVLDLFMPRLDGFGVLKALAGDPALAKLPVCVTPSAPDRVPADVRCLPKPVDLDRLLSLVDQHCAARAAAG